MKPIAAGDLVAVVRCSHNCLARYLGWHFVVSELMPQSGGGWICSNCGQEHLLSEETIAAAGITDGKFNPNIPLSWLRRIPPLSELRYADQYEESKA